MIDCCKPELKKSVNCEESNRSFFLKCLWPLNITCNSIYFIFIYLLTGEQNSPADYFVNKFKSKNKDEITGFQIVETCMYVCFELYKTIIGSFLIVFTSQKCGNKTCTIWENFLPRSNIEYSALVFNFFMAFTLFTEYIFEILREYYLMKYLKYDNNTGNNGYTIAETYEFSNKKIFKKLIPLYKIYIRFSYVVLFVYVVNIILSGIVISKNYYDNTTLISFVTNALFIIYKIYNVVDITSYKGNYFYSAYKKKKYSLQYNSR